MRGGMLPIPAVGKERGLGDAYDARKEKKKDRNYVASYSLLMQYSRSELPLLRDAFFVK